MNWNFVMAMLMLLAALGAGSFLYHRYIEPSRYGVQILAALVVGALTWCPLFAVACELFGTPCDLYSIPGFTGWIVVSAWMFERTFVRPEYKHFKEIFRRITAK